MHIHRPTFIQLENGLIRVAFVFTDNQYKKHNLVFELPEEHLNLEQMASALYLSLLLPAYSQGGVLKTDEPISKQLSENSQTILDIMHKWFPYGFKKELDLVNIQSFQETVRRPKHKVASFFTGGIDSMNTFLKHKDEIDCLIYVHKDDCLHKFKPKNLFMRNSEVQNVKAFAKKYNKELIEVATDVRTYAKGMTNWTSQYHGSLFASIAILLSKDIGKFYFGSSHSYRSLTPYASHPALDYLFETEDMRFIHDGAESTRIDKIKRISERPDVFPYLHFGCGQEDCPRTEKCIRTMMMLDIIGIRQDCPWCNKHDYTLEQVRAITLSGESDFSKAKEMYWAMTHKPKMKELREAIKFYMDVYLERKSKQRAYPYSF